MPLTEIGGTEEPVEKMNLVLAIKFGVSYGVHGEMFHQIVSTVSIGFDLE